MDLAQAAILAKQFAHLLGFPGFECDEIVPAVTDLSSNLTRRARGGAVRLSEAKAGERTAIEMEFIEIKNDGAARGMEGPDEALVEGYPGALERSCGIIDGPGARSGRETPQDIARKLLLEHDKQDDDGNVILAKSSLT